MESNPVSLSAYARLLRENRNYRLLWFAQIASEIGDWFYSVAIYSLLLEYTGTAKSIAFAFVLQVLPQFFMAPAAGVLNDRLSRKRIMIFADWMRAGIVLCMLLVRGPSMVWFLYLLLFCETIMWSMFEPGHSSTVPNIAKGPQLLVANTLASTTWAFTFAVGFALGGPVAAIFGRETVFVLNSLSFVLSALLIRKMSFEEPHLDNLPPVTFRELLGFGSVVEGLRYVARDKRMLATVFVKAGLGCMGSNWVLLPIFGERIYPLHIGGLDAKKAGILSMSILLGCRGLGSAIGPLIAGRYAHDNEKRLRMGILGGFLLAAIGYLLLGISPSLLAASAAVTLAHGGGSIVWVFSTTLLQMKTDDRLRGRVFSADFAFSMLVLSSTNFTAGILVDKGFDPHWIATATGLLILVPAALWLAAQRLWRVEGES
jgi:MFS family permease